MKVNLKSTLCSLYCDYRQLSMRGNCIRQNAVHTTSNKQLIVRHCKVYDRLSVLAGESLKVKELELL